MTDLSSKRVLVTGDVGFLGSFLSSALEARGCEQVLLARSEDFDLTLQGDIQRVFVEARPDIVIHSVGLLDGDAPSTEVPGARFFNDVMIGIQLIEHARRVGIDKFVCIGRSRAHHGLSPATRVRESRQDAGFGVHCSPPDAIEAALLAQLQAYRGQYGMRSIFVSPVAYYGPHDDLESTASTGVHGIVRACIEARNDGASSVVLKGVPGASGELLYVEDAAERIAQVIESSDDGLPIMVGSGVTVTMQQLAHSIAAITGFHGEIIWDASDVIEWPLDDRGLSDVDAERDLGHPLSISLEEGLRRTVEWYVGPARHPGAPMQALPCHPPVEEILDGDEVIAIILYGSLREPGVHFYSRPHFPQQLGFINYPVGHLIDPHVHNPMRRTVTQTQETLLVREGRVRLDFYTDAREALCSRILTGGDVVLLANGGHGLEILEPSAIIEVKQGPYAGDGEKTRFEAPGR